MAAAAAAAAALAAASVPHSSFASARSSLPSPPLAAAPRRTPSLPTLRVPPCPGDLPPPYVSWANDSRVAHSAAPFVLADGSGPAVQRTKVSVCHTASPRELVVQWWSEDNNIIAPLSGCNEPLYEHSVVEMFVGPAAGDGAPLHRYLEVEVAPTGALFLSSIENPALECKGINGTLVPCEGSGVAQGAGATADGIAGWWAFARVPLALVDAQGDGDGVHYRANFFRIDTPAGAQKEYSAWSTPLTSPACFHMPARMGFVTLVGQEADKE